MSRLTPNDIVLLTDEGKLNGLCAAAVEAQQADHITLLIAYFEDTLVRLENALRVCGLSYQRYMLLYLSSLSQLEPGTIVTALAQNFTNVTDLALDATPGPALVILIAEHYPLEGSERDLLKTLTALPGVRQIDFYSALTDPLLEKFGSGSIQKVVRQLGLNEQTPLSNPLIGSALHQAQSKISKKVYAEMTARSASEWFQLNLPE